jgi:hypothetical protein
LPYTKLNLARAARACQPPQFNFSHADQLGTIHAWSTASGAPERTCTGLPFGDQLGCSGTDVSTLYFAPFASRMELRDTGNLPRSYRGQRDGETGLDYFGARYDASSLGRPDSPTHTGRSVLSKPDRFMSPDWSSAPVPIPYADLANPQSLNLYGYARDNPETYTDPDGHAINRSLVNVAGVDPNPNDANCDGNVYCLVFASQYQYQAALTAIEEGLAEQQNQITAQQQLSSQSTQQIEQAAKQYGYNAADFEKAITAAAGKSGVNPNILVGLAYKESSLNPSAPHGGLFQIQPGRAKDLGIAAGDIGSAAAQIPKVAGALAGAIKVFHGNADLGIASWTLGVAGTQRLFSSGGMQAVRGALLDRGHPGYGTVGPNYIDVVKRFLGP